MTRWVTRLCPTCNADKRGCLHVGHLYCALVNAYEAHNSGGKFGVRFDDTQGSWLWVCGQQDIDDSKFCIRRELSWFGIIPDWWSSQSELMPKCKEFLLIASHSQNKSKEHQCKVLKRWFPKPVFSDYDCAEAIGIHHCYPPDRRLTTEHVLMDAMENCSWIIRGNDLLNEDNLYWNIGHELGLMRVRRSYLPRLIFQGDEISKTLGNFKLEEFIQRKIDPKEVISNLAIDCLKDPDQGWAYDNLKLSPTLGTWVRKYGFSI